MRRLIPCLLVVAFLGVAHAEDRPTAERYFRLGEKAYQAQNFRAAADNFEEAYKHFNLAEIAFSAAQAYRRLYRIEPKPEHVQRAVDLYNAYLSRVKSGGRVADAADALAEMQRELDKLLAKGVQVSPALAKEYTRIVINPSFGTESAGRMEEVKESSAKVLDVMATLDGQRVDAFAPINVSPGRHHVVVTAEGYFPAEKSAIAPQAAATIVDLVLVPRPARVTIDAERGASVTIDGRPTGTAPLPVQELAAGRHVVTISMRGRLPVAREVMVARGQDLVVRAPLRTTTRRKVVPYLVGGAAVATAITGVSVTFAFVRDDEAGDQLDALRITGDFTRDDAKRYERTRDARDRWRFTAILGGIAMVGLAGAAAVLYYTDHPNPDGVRIEPMTVPAGGGAAIAGRF